MISGLSKLKIGGRMLFSAIIGVRISLLALSLFLVCADVATTPDHIAFERALELLVRLAKVFPILVLVTLLLAAPLFLIALFLGLLFENSIEKYPAIWSLTAPATAWLLVSAVFSLPGHGSRFHLDRFIDEMSRMLRDDVSILVLLGCIPPAAVFYWISRHRQRKEPPHEGTTLARRSPGPVVDRDHRPVRVGVCVVHRHPRLGHGI